MSKASYKDKTKYYERKKVQKDRYYNKTKNSKNSNKKYTQDEIIMILEHKKTDRELSEILGRSMNSIQVSRIRYKKKKEYQTYCG